MITNKEKSIEFDTSKMTPDQTKMLAPMFTMIEHDAPLIQMHTFVTGALWYMNVMHELLDEEKEMDPQVVQERINSIADILNDASYKLMIQMQMDNKKEVTH